MLHVRYAHSKQTKPILEDNAILLSEGILRKGFDHKGSVPYKSLVVSLKGTDVKTN
jgi:hypothetical protein